MSAPHPPGKEGCPSLAPPAAALIGHPVAGHVPRNLLSGGLGKRIPCSLWPLILEVHRDCPPLSHVHLSGVTHVRSPSPTCRDYLLFRKIVIFFVSRVLVPYGPSAELGKQPCLLIGDTCPIFPGLFQFHCKRKKKKKNYSLKRKLHPAPSSSF